MHTLKYIINNINSQEQPIVYRLESEQKTSAAREEIYKCIFEVLHIVEVLDRLTSTKRSNMGTKKRGLIRIYLTAVLGKPYSE